MVTVKYNRFGKELELAFYEGIEDMPIVNYQQFQKYLMMSEGIGSTFEDIDNVHVSTLFSVVDHRDKLIRGIQNLRSLVYNVISGIDPTHLAFGCLIHAVNGRTIDDLSPSNINAILNQLSSFGVTNETLKKKFRKLKKRYILN